MIDTVKAISATQIYLNWTVHAYNLPIRGYNLMYRKLPSSDFNQYTKEKIGIKNTSFVLEGLDNSTEYQIKLEVSTGYGSSTPYIYPQIVKTLDKNPVFVPNISINGFSATSVTIGKFSFFLHHLFSLLKSRHDLLYSDCIQQIPVAFFKLSTV